MSLLDRFIIYMDKLALELDNRYSVTAISSSIIILPKEKKHLENLLKYHGDVTSLGDLKNEIGHSR